MDWLLFFSSSQLRRTDLLFEDLKNSGKVLDYDTFQDYCMKSLEAGFKFSSRKFLNEGEVGAFWVKFWKEQKNLGEF